jgi:hypothetical protein
VIEIEITAKDLIRAFDGCFNRVMPLLLLNIFSVTTIPSSTTKPVARTIANKVNTLMEKPNNHMIKKVAINETEYQSGLKAIAQSLKK